MRLRHVLGAAWLSFAVVALCLTTASPAPGQIEGPGAPETTECAPPETAPVPGQELYKGSDPSRNLLPYSPERIVQYPCPYPSEYRGVIVRPDQVLMVQGGQLIRRIKVGVTGSSTTYTLPRLAALVGDRGWLGEVAPGVYQIDAAIVQRDSTLLVTAPQVREVRLTTRPHVFIAGERAAVLFEGVKVTSWNPATNGPDTNPVDGRPFINYESGSRLDIGRSEFSFLGSDRTGAYGVSWRTLGTTGRALDSIFSDNFFGAYTGGASDIEFRRNVFRNNTYYGLDPHTDSSRLVIDDNEAYGNGTHGIIFSQFVTDSVISNNRVHDNGASGIVLHADSDGNRIENNLVEGNAEDGIVLIGSGGNDVEKNTVRRNRVGIRIHELGSDRTRVLGNLVEQNAVGAKVYAGATEAVLADNVIRGSGDAGIVIDAPLSQVLRTQIVGGRRGLDLDGVVDVKDTNVSDVDEGIRAAPSAIVDVSSVKVNARRAGVRMAPGAIVDMRDVQLTAPTAVVRPRSAATSWTDYLPFVGLGALVIAVGLEVLRRARNRHQPQVQAPPHVLNSA